MSASTDKQASFGNFIFSFISGPHEMNQTTADHSRPQQTTSSRDLLDFRFDQFLDNGWQ